VQATSSSPSAWRGPITGTAGDTAAGLRKRRSQPPTPMPTPPSSSAMTPGTLVVTFALGLGTQLSTSTPCSLSLEHTATRLVESAIAGGAPLIANTAAAPANAKNRAVRDRVPAVTRSIYIRPPLQDKGVAKPTSTKHIWQVAAARHRSTTTAPNKPRAYARTVGRPAVLGEVAWHCSVKNDGPDGPDGPRRLRCSWRWRRIDPKDYWLEESQQRRDVMGPQQPQTHPGTLARIWSASFLRSSPMLKPCASISITTLALATMARSLLKPGRLPCSEF